jgi:ZIP family zinc transporter
MDGYTLPQLLQAFSLSLIAGLSTAIGAVIAFFLPGRRTTVLSVGLGFSGGVMVYVSFMEMLPDAVRRMEEVLGAAHGEAAAVGAFFAGLALAGVIDRLVPDDVNPHELKSPGELEEIQEERPQVDLHRTGLFTAIAIAIHNFPEGFATFVAALADPVLGVSIAVAIAIHNIPEGMAVSLPIYHATGDRRRAFWYSVLSGLTEPVGALIGFLLFASLLSDSLVGLVLALVAGIMVYISFDELLPAARVYGNGHSTIFGVAGGMFVMALSLWLLRVV